MKTLVYILIFSSHCIVTIAQDLHQGQLYAEANENLVDINVNTPLNTSWIDVDNLVVSTKSEQFTSYKNLAIYLTNRFSEQHSKARSIYTWIALNISYDQTSIVDASFKNKQNAQCVWENRIAVCEGFANLFHEMCKVAGLESRVIKGYVKDFGGMDFKFPNHAWNSVKIEGKWRLLDATWASVNNEGSLLTNPETDKSFVRHKLDHFFLVNPNRMIYTHMPEDPFWQLQNNYVSLETFLKGRDYIESVLSRPYSDTRDFEQLISNYEELDSLDKTISYLERMECTKWNHAKAYGLGVAYYYKAQSILKDANKERRYQAIEKAKIYYNKSLEQLMNLQKEDYGYEFSKDLANSVEIRIASLQ